MRRTWKGGADGRAGCRTRSTRRHRDGRGKEGKEKEEGNRMDPKERATHR